MSITLATKGRLWPRANIVREQFSEISVIIYDPLEVSIMMDAVDDISASVDPDDLVVSVESVDSEMGVDIDPDDISGNTDGCN